MTAATLDAPTVLARADDVRSGCPWIPDDSIDLGIMSPPYFEGDGATLEMFHALGKLLLRVLRDGARAYVNLGQVSEDFDRIYDARAAILAGGAPMGAQGPHKLHTWQTIAWIKSFAPPGEATRGHYQPMAMSDHLLYYGHELVFQFVKGKPRKAGPLDKLAIGVPYADKGNLTRGGRGKNGDVHDPGDAWAIEGTTDTLFIPYETTGKTEKKDHPHAYPPELVRRLILLANIPAHSTILDPFIGGGTTAEVALGLGHHVVAVDKNPERIEGLKRIKAIVPQSAGYRINQANAALSQVTITQQGPVSIAEESLLRVPAENAGDLTPRRRRTSRTLAALMTEHGIEKPDSCTQDEDEPADEGDDPTNPPVIPGKLCPEGHPLHRTASGDLCEHGHGEFTGRPVRKKKAKAKASKKARR